MTSNGVTAASSVVSTTNVTNTSCIVVAPYCYALANFFYWRWILKEDPSVPISFLRRDLRIMAFLMNCQFSSLSPFPRAILYYYLSLFHNDRDGTSSSPNKFHNFSFLWNTTNLSVHYYQMNLRLFNYCFRF